MFVQAERLDRVAFAHTYTHGRKVHMPGLLLVCEYTPTLKVAVVVGKKVAKSAVARNLLRRRLYAALHETNVSSGHIIIIAKPAAKEYSYQRLRAEVSAALNRIVGARAHSR